MKLLDMKNLSKLEHTLLLVATYLEAQGNIDKEHKPYLHELASECRQGVSNIGKIIY